MFKQFIKVIRNFFHRSKSPSSKRISTKKPASKKRSVRRHTKKISGRITTSTIDRAKLKRIIPKSPVQKVLQLREIGEITHFFAKIQVVVVKVTKSDITVGDEILIKGSYTNFQQKVLSLQIESLDVKSGKKGQLVGMKVVKGPKVGDKVYKILR